MENNDTNIRAFEMMIHGLEEKNIMIPSYCFKTNDEKIHYAVKKYFEDKMTYLNTGTWPKKNFLQRDMVWEYYHYLKISDATIKIDNYFDFNYDTNTWTRNKLEETINKYGKKVLFKLAVFLELKPNKSFDEWYEEVINDEDLKHLEEALKEHKFIR